MSGVELLALIPAGALMAFFGWLGKAYLSRQVLAGESKKAELDTDAALEKHRDGLTFQLLEAARFELSEMRKELTQLRPLEAHLFHLQQALEHIDALLTADPDERPSAERNARAFLRRMREQPFMRKPSDSEEPSNSGIDN